MTIHVTRYDPNGEDMVPSLAEASADERALRRRRPVPRDPVPDGGVDLLAALERSVATAQRLSRERRR